MLTPAKSGSRRSTSTRLSAASHASGSLAAHPLECCRPAAGEAAPLKHRALPPCPRRAGALANVWIRGVFRSVEPRRIIMFASSGTRASSSPGAAAKVSIGASSKILSRPSKE